MPRSSKKRFKIRAPKFLRPAAKAVKGFWGDHGLWRKIWFSVAVVAMLVVGSMYAIARWYIYSNRNQPLQLGTTFIPDYARQLGVNPQQTLSAIVNDLGVRQLRFVSYWNDIEPAPGVYNFSDLDWEFAQADAVGAKVSLSIGLRQPRWPECHMPAWAASQPTSVWYGELDQFMGKVIDRYKSNPALQSYQLENEFFLKVFGQCTDFNRSRLVNEFNYVKKQDPIHPVIIARSNNAIGLPVGQPTPDEFGVSVYKRVYDKTITHRYYEYPFPAWFYGFLAGAGKILTGKNMIIHELQAEPWPPPQYNIATAPISELYKSMSPQILKDRFQYGEATGIRSIYLWGAEWWYQMKVNRNDPALWNVAKQEFQSAAKQQ